MHNAQRCESFSTARNVQKWPVEQQYEVQQFLNSSTQRVLRRCSDSSSNLKTFSPLVYLSLCKAPSAASFISSSKTGSAREIFLAVTVILRRLTQQRGLCSRLCRPFRDTKHAQNATPIGTQNISYPHSHQRQAQETKSIGSGARVVAMVQPIQANMPNTPLRA
jgi:hypothetical protein